MNVKGKLHPVETYSPAFHEKNKTLSFLPELRTEIVERTGNPHVRTIFGGGVTGKRYRRVQKERGREGRADDVMPPDTHVSIRWCERNLENDSVSERNQPDTPRREGTPSQRYERSVCVRKAE